MVDLENVQFLSLENKKPSEKNESLHEDDVVNLFDPAASPRDRKKLATKLEKIEQNFLNAQFVMTPDVCEKDLINIFDKTKMDNNPRKVKDYFKKITDDVFKNSVHCCAPTMIGHMTTSLPFYMRPLSKMLTTLHCNNVKIETGKATTFLEKEAIAMLHRHFFNRDNEFYEAFSNRPDKSLGVICSGGTVANNTALWIARNRCLPANDEFKGCDKEGVSQGLIHYNYKKAVLIGSEIMHYSMKKAADILGIGTDNIVTCPFDSNYMVDVEFMRKRIEECREKNIAIIALVGVVGATETGSVDDLEKISKLAQEFNIHFHVDAAWGGPIMFSKRHKHIAKGIEHADTITLDGHKQLYTPMGCGICFLKNPELIHSVEKTANYIIRKESYDLGKFSLEGSRPAVSLYLHANLEILGVDGFGALIDKSFRLVKYMYWIVNIMNQTEVLFAPMTNIFLYRFVPKKFQGREDYTLEENKEIDQLNINLQDEQKRKGKTFVSRTTIYSPTHKARVVALRVVIANPLTNEIHIRKTLADQVEIINLIESSE